MLRMHLLSMIAVASFAAVSPSTLPAAEKSDASAVVKKGIAFRGGAKTLRSFRAVTFADKGTYYGMGDGLPYTGKYAILWPDKFRMEIQGIFAIAITSDSGWVSSQGSVMDMSKKQLADKQHLHYESIVTQLHPLLDGKTYTLTLDGKATVGKSKTVIVKVQSKGKRDVRLFFNPESGELLKSEMMAAPDAAPGSETSEKLVKQESFYSNYKSAQGIKYASKLLILRGGKKYIESTVSDYKPLKTLDEKTFAKPKS